MVCTLVKILTFMDSPLNMLDLGMVYCKGEGVIILHDNEGGGGCSAL